MKGMSVKMKNEILYHASGEIVEYPEIRKGKYTKDFSWGLAKFRYPTHQISFHTLEALDCISFERSMLVDE